MTDLPAEKQAAKAIAHTLRNISERPGVAWYLGYGTQTYALLTEALGTLNNKMMAEIQSIYPPADQPQYNERDLAPCPFCQGHAIFVEEEEKHLLLCPECGARGPGVDEFMHDSKLDAMDCAARKWNERVMPR